MLSSSFIHCIAKVGYGHINTRNRISAARAFDCNSCIIVFFVLPRQWFGTDEQNSHKKPALRKDGLILRCGAGNGTRTPALYPSYAGNQAVV